MPFSAACLAVWAASPATSMPFSAACLAVAAASPATSMPFSAASRALPAISSATSMPFSAASRATPAISSATSRPFPAASRATPTISSATPAPFPAASLAVPLPNMPLSVSMSFIAVPLSYLTVFVRSGRFLISGYAERCGASMRATPVARQGRDATRPARPRNHSAALTSISTAPVLPALVSTASKRRRWVVKSTSK